MKGFIQLTDYDGGTIYLDPDAILCIRGLPAEQTDGGRELPQRTRIDTLVDLLLVRESPKEIAEAMGVSR